MAKFFNTTGPCRVKDHYMLDPLHRLGDVRLLIDDKQFFVIHAPRQTGKTTALEALASALTAEGKYTALKFSCEMGQAFAGNIKGAEDAVIEAILTNSEIYLPPNLQCPRPKRGGKTGTKLKALLTAWAQVSPRPLVLFFDEIDALVDASLDSVLRQLRDGFSNRPHAFPQSIVL